MRHAAIKAVKPIASRRSRVDQCAADFCDFARAHGWTEWLSRAELREAVAMFYDEECREPVSEEEFLSSFAATPGAVRTRYRLLNALDPALRRAGRRLGLARAVLYRVEAEVNASAARPQLRRAA